MRRWARTAGGIAIAFIVILAVVFVGHPFGAMHKKLGGTITVKGPNSPPAIGPPVRGNVLPDAEPLPFLGGYLELWSFSPPTSVQGIQINNQSVPPLFTDILNSTGNVSGHLPNSFYTIAQDWSNYFAQGGQKGAETSFSIEITYDFALNSSAMKVYSYSDFIPYNPEAVTSSYQLNLTLHPNLSGRPYLISINGTPYQQLPSGTLVPMLNNSSATQPSRICPPSGCEQCDYYVWYVWNSTPFNNADLPLLWVNDTGTAGNSTMVAGVTIGAIHAQTGFNAGEGYHSSTTFSSNYISTGSSYTSPPGAVGTTQVVVYTPQENKTASFAYIWIEGNFSVTNYREAIYNTCNGEKTWLDYYETVPYVVSLDIKNNTFVMNATYWGYSPYNPWTSVQAIKELNLSSAIVSNYTDRLAVRQEAEWNEIYDTVTGSYNNIEGIINGIVGVGLALLGLVVTAEAATGWAPGSGWAAIGLTVLAVAGVVSAALSLLLNGVVDVSSSTFLFAADYLNDGLFAQPLAGNSITLNVYAINASISYNGNNYRFPILYGTGN